MAALMSHRFVPAQYNRELLTRLRRLTQGTKTVEDYFQEMERLMLKADVDETTDATMARFLSGLNRDLQDRMELQKYASLPEMLHKAISVEQQLKRKGTSRPAYGTSSRLNYQEDKTTYPARSDTRFKPETNPSSSTADYRGKAEGTPARTRDIECFKCRGKGNYTNKCPNQRAMLILDSGEIVSEGEEDTGPKYDDEDAEKYAAEGELLVARRVLLAHEPVKEEDQRENLFHTRCHVMGKVYSLIIDGESCTNVASTTMVEKLGLETRKHPQPYSLRWLNNQRQLKVTKQVSVPLSIGRYEDQVVCDVLPMEVGHILLGRPWQFDKKAIHAGFTIKHTFEHHGRNITLAPLSPRDVYLDQMKLEQSNKGKSVVSEPPNTSTKNESLREPPEKAFQGTLVSKETLFVRPCELKHAVHTKQSLVLLMFKSALASLTDPQPDFPSSVLPLLQEFKDVFPDESPAVYHPYAGLNTK
ncbi:uncharacterized protein LOC112089116 [Eutrema salsugineum]|uniref:uncharacterized protein LOC112089116 n=1 Tax=Eutrema salsugineum TaxID=72664 RepID=UPI000CED4CF5|nr:uncharacterized protein LOC112089116 [Eutrema salsugineum]